MLRLSLPVHLAWTAMFPLLLSGPAKSFSSDVDGRLSSPEPRHIRSTVGHVFLADPDDGSYHEVQLQRLDGDGRKLSGTYVLVTSNRLQASGEPVAVRDDTGDFRYEPNLDEEQDCIRTLSDCSAFDAVNIYYHIDRFATDYWRDRMGIDVDFQAKAVTHIAGDGAFANPRENTLKFGVGSLFMKNSALEDEIIYHEYTHLVTWSLGFRVDTSSSVETRALNEGIAHYFAATYTDDPRIGEWLVTCPERRHCTGPPNDRELLTLETDPRLWNWNDGAPADGLRYGSCTRFYEDDGKCKTSYNNFDYQYVWAMIWAGALWDVRNELGAEVVDRLLVDALRYSSKTWTFSRALGGILASNEVLFGGANGPTIAALFAERGIHPHVEAAAEKENAIDEPLHVRAYPNPTDDDLTITFSLRNTSAARISVVDVLGREVAVVSDQNYAPGSHAVSWSGLRLPSGRYHVLLVADGRTAMHPITLLP